MIKRAAETFDKYKKGSLEVLPVKAETVLILLSTVLLVGLWELVASQHPSHRFPGLGLVLSNTVEVLSGDARYDPGYTYGVSLLRITLGFVISMVVATVVGIYMGLRTDVEDYLSVPLFVALTVPSVVWAFLTVMWFGITFLLVPVAVIVLIVVPYLTVNIWEGTKNLDNKLVEMAHSFNASNTEVWRHIYIPHLLPFLFSTSRMGFAIAWKISLVAEVFGSSSGIGVAANFFFETNQPSYVIAWALPIMLLMFALERGLHRVENRAFEWREDSQALEVTE